MGSVAITFPGIAGPRASQFRSFSPIRLRRPVPTDPVIGVRQGIAPEGNAYIVVGATSSMHAGR
jgi:hypothetical protein